MVALAVALWAVGAILAVFDGRELLKITTPLATCAFGWLFADKAVS